jgi:hypothetical protein
MPTPYKQRESGYQTCNEARLFCGTAFIYFVQIKENCCWGLFVTWQADFNTKVNSIKLGFSTINWIHSWSVWVLVWKAEAKKPVPQYHHFPFRPILAFMSLLLARTDDCFTPLPAANCVSVEGQTKQGHLHTRQAYACSTVPVWSLQQSTKALNSAPGRCLKVGKLRHCENSVKATCWI